MKLIILFVLCSQAFAVDQVVVPQTGVGATSVPPHVQQLAEQHINHVLQHVPKVQQHIKEQKEQGAQHKLPDDIKQQINSHINQVVDHVQSEQKVQGQQQVPHHVHQVVQQAHQHIPQVIQQHLSSMKVPHVVGKPVQKINVADSVLKPSVQGADHVQQIVQHVSTHVPQLIQHHVAQKKAMAVPSQLGDKVQQLQQQAQSHIPQVINQHIEQQKGQQQPQVPQVVSEKVAPENKPQVSAHAQEVVQHVHQHVAQVVNHHQVNQADKVRATRAIVPAHVHQIVQQVHQHVPHVIHQHKQQQQHHEMENESQPDSKCSFHCTNTDLPVCATNGKCWKQYDSLCVLSKWNCLNTQKIFRQVDDAECMDSTKVKCYPGDM